MDYHAWRLTRPPPLFELLVRHGLQRLALARQAVLPPRLQRRLYRHVEAMLLAENLAPTRKHIEMIVNNFAQLVEQSQSGQPILYKKRNTLSLLFDVFSVQSEMDLDCPDQLMLGYTQSMMGFLLFQPHPRQIGMIGLGGGSLAKFCYHHLPHAAITVAENDARVIAFRDAFHIPADGERFQVQCMDGADFVAQRQRQFDVLVVDGFDRDGQPAQLCSERFYADCYDALGPEGVLVVNLLNDDLHTQQYIERLERSFAGAVIAIDAWDSLNRIVFAYKGRARDFNFHTVTRQIALYEPDLQAMLLMVAHGILQQQRRQLGQAGHRQNYGLA